MPEVCAAEKRIIDPLMVQLHTGNIVLIEGGRGTGKTHVLKWFLRYLSGASNLVPCGISEPLDTHILSTALTTLIKRNTGDKIKTAPVLIDFLVDIIRRFYTKQHRRIVLLLDEGDSLALKEEDSLEVEKEKRKTVRWLRILSDLPAVVVYIAGLTGFSKAGLYLLWIFFSPVAILVAQFQLNKKATL